MAQTQKSITVFISSRFAEFEELRAKIAKEAFSPMDVAINLTLNMLDHRGGVADSRSPAIASITEAKNSDIFILLLGETYKSNLSDNDYEKSYTHQEYDSAVASGLHILAFPIGDCYDTKNKKLSNHPTFREFQDSVLESHYNIYAPYTPTDYDIDKLYQTIYHSLQDLIINKVTDKREITDKDLSTRPMETTIVGRESELKQIDEELHSSSSLLLINGIGGVGKSHIASYYLYSQRDKLDYYGWFDGLESFVSELKTRFDLKSEKSDELWREALNKLRELNGKKLLVIDDIKATDNQKHIDGILALEHSGYKILFTSREQMRGVESYRLDILTLEDARKLFVTHFTTDELDKVDRIVGYLDRHALFVELVAKTMESEGYSVDGIIEKFVNSELSKIEFVDDSGDDAMFEQNLKELFEMQRETLKDEYIILLQKLSTLPSIDIEYALLEQIIGTERLKGKLNFLSKKGWLTQTENSYKLHQIIKMYILSTHTPTKDEISPLITNLTKLMGNTSDAKVSIENQPYLIYYESMREIVERLEIEVEQLGDFYGHFANIYRDLGDYPKAEPLYQKSLSIREKLLGEEHPDTATSYGNLAGLYKSMGAYDKAEPLYLKSLKIKQKLLGEEHPSTATSYNNLAGLYRSMGVYDKAEPLYQKSLSIREKLLGEEHPDTATSYGNLAELYRSMGAYDKAEPLYQKAMRIQEKLLGEEHPNTAISYNNLALLYKSMGAYDKAEPLYQKDIKISEKLLGEEHPNTAISYNNLANLYYQTRRYQESAEYMRRAIAIREKVLPSDHPYLQGSIDGLKIIESMI